jgi:hypothetical protein
MQDTNLFKRHEQAVADLILSAKQNLTAPSGSQVFHSDLSDPDNDVTTVVGPAAGAAGVAQWVGDTTAPGVPTGISASSASGIVTVTWDGTLDGGVPEDFAYVTVLIDGVERGRLTHAGALPVDGLTVGAQVQVTATASDAARLEDGTLSPNVSAETEPVTVTVASVVSQEELDAVAKTAAAAKTAGDQAASDAAAAQGDAQSALDKLAGTVQSELGDQVTAAAAAATAVKPLIQDDYPTSDEQVQDRLWIDTAARTYAWTGTPNASASTESVDGVVQATNFVLNPRTVGTAGDDAGLDQWGVSGSSAVFDATHVLDSGMAVHVSWDGSGVPQLRRVPLSLGETTWEQDSVAWCADVWVPTAGDYAIFWGGKDRNLALAAGWNHLAFTADATLPGVHLALFIGKISTAGAGELWITNICVGSATYFDGGTAPTAANTPKRWNGSEWEAVTDGTAAAAAQTASSALTVATGKITTGTGTPSASGHVTGDLYLQTDSSGHVINILVFNASSTWVPYILVASALLVASSVGTTQIADGAITTAKLVASCVTAAQIDAGAITTDKLAANSVTAAKVEASEALLEKLLVRKIVADDIDVGSLAAAIVTSTEFHTADGRLGFDSTNGFYAKDTNGNYVFKVDTTGKLTAVGAEISGTLSNVTPLSSTVIDEDGVEIRGTGWKFPYPVSIPEPITSYLFASSDHYLAGITYDSRTLYQWYTPGGGMGTPTKITIPIGDPIKGLSWLGTSKYLVLRSKQSGSTVAWRVEVWNMSGAVQATYNLPSTDTSWYGAIAQYPDGSGFYVAMGNSSTTGTIYRYNSSGVLQKQWTLPVTDYFGGSVPQAMAVDSSGNLYLSQAGNTRCYTPAGVAKWSLVGGFTSLTFDNIHSYLVEGIGQSVTWADPSTGNLVGATPVPELIQSLALMDFNGANLYVLSAVGPKIIVGEWSTPATEEGQSVVIYASSGTASFHNTIDVTSVISQYPMSQADGERVSGVHLASSLTDLNGVSTTHLLAGLSRGFVPKFASNQTDAGDYVWDGSAWVPMHGGCTLTLTANENAPGDVNVNYQSVLSNTGGFGTVTGASAGITIPVEDDYRIHIHGFMSNSGQCASYLQNVLLPGSTAEDGPYWWNPMGGQVGRYLALHVTIYRHLLAGQTVRHVVRNSNTTDGVMTQTNTLTIEH